MRGAGRGQDLLDGAQLRHVGHQDRQRQVGCERIPAHGERVQAVLQRGVTLHVGPVVAGGWRQAGHADRGNLLFDVAAAE